MRKYKILFHVCLPGVHCRLCLSYPVVQIGDGCLGADFLGGQCVAPLLGTGGSIYDFISKQDQRRKIEALGFWLDGQHGLRQSSLDYGNALYKILLRRLRFYQVTSSTENMLSCSPPIVDLQKRHPIQPNGLNASIPILIKTGQYLCVLLQTRFIISQLLLQSLHPVEQCLKSGFFLRLVMALVRKHVRFSNPFFIADGGFIQFDFADPDGLPDRIARRANSLHICQRHRMMC